MWLSLTCAIVATFSYGIVSVLQAVAAQRTERHPNLDALLLVRLVGQLPYVAGIGLDLVGFAATVIALRDLPLFLVQSAVAASVGVTAIGASIAFGLPLGRNERLALGGLVIGFALLAVSAQPEEASTLGAAGRWVLIAGVVVVLALGVASARLADPHVGVALALMAGISWAAMGVAARVLVVPSPFWHLVTEPIAIALVAYGILGTLYFATALQRGSVTAATALLLSVETVVASGLGFAFLGDQTRPDFAVVAILGLVVTVGASIVLARSSAGVPHAVPAGG